ncbi:hypothetical protein DAI18_16905 [Microvirgula aerodenitrificans]|uniref:Cyclic di-GMP-binding protein n=1 Tax=Microvirgula aerodenitrificans TaxID=57480 RepID=A0A2S0PDS6_9NEIS|nr:cellulose biosynthesis cyclic di-GMP-binding regulatory protein BcsB [Microvirgula aerodenitrificans]AVY95538.1 hypothetical protein DAI18_16905 [Microvirgula aerodenitrificans]
MPTSHRAARPRLLLPTVFCVLVSQVWAAGSPAEQFQEWTADTWVNRQISLAALGLRSPVVLSGGDSRREFFLPVPAGVPIDAATVQINASYLRADGGRSTLLLSADDVPVTANRYTDDKGDASQRIDIAGGERPNGFVRLGIGWSSVISDLMCADQRAPGNALRLNPDSLFQYRYDRSAVRTLATAWSALPATPVLLVSGKSLSPQAYDTAWRVGVTLERAGKRVRIQALPAVGTTVDLATVRVPDSLRGIPAFAALAGGSGSHRIASAAETGALLALGRNGPLGTDLLIDEPALRTAMSQALDALGEQVRTSGEAATAAWDEWRKHNGAPLDVPSRQDQVRLGVLAGNPVIIVAQGAGARAAGLLGSLWRPAALGRDLTVTSANTPAVDNGSVLLDQFGAVSGTMDIIARGERVAAFDLGAVAGDGRYPSQLVLDVASAPNAGGEGPVLSVLLNDYLLGAEKLEANGNTRRLAVNIPRYALAARNEIRIVFLRQPTQIRCHDQPTPYPVSIQKSSHLRLGKGAPGDDFVGASIGLAGDHAVLVPDTWLKDAPTSLARMIRLSDAVGATGEHAQLKVVASGQKPDVSGHFIAFDVPSMSGGSEVAVDGGKLVLKRDSNTTLLDLSGLQRLTVAEVVDGGRGIAFRTVGSEAPDVPKPFRLARGNFAVIDEGGPTLQIDTADPTSARLADEGNPQSMWERHMWAWLALIGVIAFMLMAARIAQVRRRRQDRARVES